MLLVIRSTEVHFDIGDKFAILKQRVLVNWVTETMRVCQTEQLVLKRLGPDLHKQDTLVNHCKTCFNLNLFYLGVGTRKSLAGLL